MANGAYDNRRVRFHGLVAGVEIDHGVSRYANAQGLSSTMIDFSTYRVQRAGVCFDQIAAVMKEEFDVTLEAPERGGAA